MQVVKETVQLFLVPGGEYKLVCTAPGGSAEEYTVTADDWELGPQTLDHIGASVHTEKAPDAGPGQVLMQGEFLGEVSCCGRGTHVHASAQCWPASLARMRGRDRACEHVACARLASLHLNACLCVMHCVCRTCRSTTSRSSGGPASKTSCCTQTLRAPRTSAQRARWAARR